MISIELLDKDNPDDRNSARYLKTFNVWKRTWSEEYAALGLNAPLHSDNFTRQKFVVSVFLGDRCAALSCLHVLDLTFPPHLDDSWLRPWPGEVLAQVSAVDKQVLLWNSFTVASDFRGQVHFGTTMKDAVAASCVRAFERHTDFKIMLGSTRNNRKVNRALYDVGGTRLSTVEHYNEPTDLIWFKKSENPILNADREALLANWWIEKPPISHFFAKLGDCAVSADRAIA